MSIRLSIGPLDPATVEDVHTLAAHATLADGVRPLSEQPLLDLTTDDPDLTHVVVHVDAGSSAPVVGYAQVDRRGTIPSAELVVDPEHRRRGIGRTLLRTAQRDATLPSRSGAPAAHPELRIWAHGFVPGSRAFAAAMGLHVVRELQLLTRPLDDVRDDAAALRAELGARTFRPGEDDDAWVASNARVFAQHPEQGRLSLSDLQSREAQSWFDPSLFFVVPSSDEPDRLDAFLWLKVEAPGASVAPADGEAGTGDGSGFDGLASTAELYVLGVDPSAQGRGLGSRLTRLALATLRDVGADHVELWVDADNVAAVATYAKAGFTVASRDVQLSR